MNGVWLLRNLVFFFLPMQISNKIHEDVKRWLTMLSQEPKGLCAASELMLREHLAIARLLVRISKTSLEGSTSFSDAGQKQELQFECKSFALPM